MTTVAPSVRGSTLLDFKETSNEVLRFLHKRYGFDLWLVTRTEGEDWIVLQSEDNGYGVASGSVFRWSDSFCSQMVRGNGPCIAPDSKLVPAYAAAPIGRQVEIGAYIGVPIQKPDGGLFGTLCAIDPERQPETLKEELDLIQLLAAMLSTVLQMELRSQEAARQAERLKLEAETDGLTGLPNRRAWDNLIAREEERCRLYGHPGGMVCVDLDGLKRLNDTQGHDAGDDLIQRTAEALRAGVDPRHIVARLGGDEFGVALLESDRAACEAAAGRMREELARRDVAASVGLAQRIPGESFQAAWQVADGFMLREKRAKGAGRS